MIYTIPGCIMTPDRGPGAPLAGTTDQNINCNSEYSANT